MIMRLLRESTHVTFQISWSCTGKHPETSATPSCQTWRGILTLDNDMRWWLKTRISPQRRAYIYL